MDTPEPDALPEPTPIVSPERWLVLEPLLDAALELSPEDRGSFLDRACGGDSALRAELVAMLEECERDDPRLSRAAAERFAFLLDERHDLLQLRAALAPRYALERVLGQGGMGTVYLARDLRHEREVAVKVLAPELAGTANAARFLDEIRLTAQLRHPHILPLFDSGVADRRPWYVAPYVEGGTLRDRLTRDGLLPLADALRILREVASALAYAHARGVVHRDVKPENVLLDVGGAVLGDFGIAQAIERATLGPAPEPGAFSPRLTAAAFGTPTYMAPEQFTPGTRPDHRVDLYALGVIAHEMLHGRPPRRGSSAIAVTGVPDDQNAPGVRRRASTPGESDASEANDRPGVPAVIEALVSRLLAEEAADRVQSADALLQQLDELAASVGMSDAESSRSAPTRTGRSRRMVRGAIAVVGLLGLAGASSWVLHTRRAAVGLSAHRVMVVPFENATGDPALAMLGRMAADWVAQGLVRTGAVDVSSEVPTPEVGGERALRDVARKSGAGTLVSGAYYLDGDSVRLQARIIDVADWTLLRPVEPVAAARDAPQSLLEPLRQRVMAILAVTHDPRIEGWAMGSPPPTFEAYEQLIAGLDLFAEGNWVGALPLWERAAALDSSFVQPLLHSVFGYMNLGRLAEADSLVRVIERRGAFSPFDRAMLDFQRAEIMGDHMATLSAAHAMVRAAPGAELPHYLHAVAALRVNRPREALDATSRISSRVGRFGTPWSSAIYWGVVTGAHHMLGEHGAELEAARLARDLHPGNREILWYELRALAALGRTREIEPALGKLERLPATPAGRSLSSLYIELADELDAHAHSETARAVLLRAERWQRTHESDTGNDADAIYDRARILQRLGYDDAADRLFAGLEATRPDDPRYLAYRGLGALRRKLPADAERFAERLRTLRAPYDRGLTPYLRARLAAHSGDTGLALALIRLALAEGFPYGTQLHSTPGLAPLRNEPEFHELLEPNG